MDEIPEDIRAAAQKVADACQDDYYWDAIFKAAARAIAAERERCAKIAERTHAPLTALAIRRSDVTNGSDDADKWE